MFRIFAQASALAVVLALATPTFGQTNLAEGFSKLPSDAKVALMPLDVELFEVSAGGVAEPRADWTTAALEHVKVLLRERKSKIGARIVDLEDSADEKLADLNRLHGAVGAAITAHHFGFLKLATKDGKLDWSLGPEASVLRRNNTADYALFIYLRDSYASSERVAVMVVGALFGVGIAPGAVQQGYASLVDLETGRIVWFNRLMRSTGDLRVREKASESLDALLAGFPQ